MNPMQIINIAAIILSPIFAVLVGQRLQNIANNRKDKMEIFKKLSDYRHFIDPFFSGGKRNKEIDESIIRNINLIPMVFCKDKIVMEACKKMRENHANIWDRAEKSAVLPKDVENYLNSFRLLLMAIAKTLGYTEYEVFSFKVVS